MGFWWVAWGTLAAHELPRSNRTPPYSPKAHSSSTVTLVLTKIQLRATNTPAGTNVDSLSFVYPNIWLSMLTILLRSIYTASLYTYTHVDIINYNKIASWTGAQLEGVLLTRIM